MHLLLQAGASQLCARAAYATSASMAAMRQPDLSLQAVAAAANLLQERAAVRQGRVAALGIVDLCGDMSADAALGGEGAALKRHSRCLQVLCVFSSSLIFHHSCDFQATLNARVLVGKFG